MQIQESNPIFSTKHPQADSMEVKKNGKRKIIFLKHVLGGLYMLVPVEGKLLKCKQNADVVKKLEAALFSKGL